MSLHTESTISVIIPSFRSAQTLYKCLESVTNQQTEWCYEVIVVHSGPEPISQQVRLDFESVRFHEVAERWFPGKARNWAVRRVTSPWIMFLDADCVVKEDWIQELVSTAMEQNTDGAGGGVGNARVWSLVSWTMHLLEFGEWLPGGKPRICENFPTCNSVYRRSALLEAGGFPEEFYPGEDTLLNYFLYTKGYKLVFVPECYVNHINTRNAMGILRYNYEHGFFYGRICRTHGLPGHSLAYHNRTLILVAVIALRFIRVFMRLFPRHMMIIPLFIAAIPLIVASLFAWGMGFADACKTQTAELHTVSETP